MIHFSPSTAADIERIDQWRQHDPYHFHQGQPEWWLGAEAVLAFCLTDVGGPLCYVRLDNEDEYIRIHIQFAPEEVVSKRRLVKGLLHGLETIKNFYFANESITGFIFNSVNPTLIGFMERQGFVSVGNDDYKFEFFRG